MADHSTFRAAPDPEFADRLEALLLQRLDPSGDPTTTDPEVGGLIVLDAEVPASGPTAPPRSPRRRLLLLAAAAAVVVAALAGTLLATDRDEEIDTITPTPTVTPAPSTTSMPATSSQVWEANKTPLQPVRRYSVDPDGDDDTSLRVTFQGPPEGWLSWFGAVKYLPGDADGFTGLSITTVTNLVSDGCRDHTPLDPPVGPTVDDLATALSRLAPFELTAPPTDVTLFGYQGKHLELTVPARTDLSVSGGGAVNRSKNVAEFTDCVEDELHSWISPINVQSVGSPSSPGLLGHSTDSRGAFNAYQAPGQSEEFWILDVDGTRLVVVSFDTPGAPATDVAERDAMFESIRIEP
jgi:hypothetical protein